VRINFADARKYEKETKKVAETHIRMAYCGSCRWISTLPKQGNKTWITCTCGKSTARRLHKYNIAIRGDTQILEMAKPGHTDPGNTAFITFVEFGVFRIPSGIKGEKLARELKKKQSG